MIYQKVGGPGPFGNGLICYPVGRQLSTASRGGDIIIVSPPYIASREELVEIVEEAGPAASAK